jgi:3-hydroxyacyl-CoA dehydrogenase
MGEIKTAAVIGAGTMGSGIAGHLANAGVPVVLLDVVPEGAENRNLVAERAVERLLASSPPALMHPDKAPISKTIWASWPRPTGSPRRWSSAWT